MQTMYELLTFFGSIASIIALIILVIVAMYISKAIEFEESPVEVAKEESGLVDV